VIVSLLLALAQVSASQDPLTLHPATPHVLIDVPDVAALMDAYPSAPAMQLAADSAAREALSKLESNLELDMAGSLASALELLGLDAGSGDVDILALARKARRITLSYATHERTIGELAHELAQMRDAQLEALDLEELLEATADAEPDERLREDPWGRAYEIARSPEGKPSVVSRGSDGQPGGAGSAADVGSEFDASAWLEGELERRRALLLTIEFLSEDVARESWSSMRDMLGVPTSEPAETHSLLGTDGVVERFLAARLERAPGWSWRANRHMVLALGALPFETVLARSTRDAPSLLDEPSWIALRSLSAPSAGVTVAQGAFDTDWMGELLTGAIDLLPDTGEREPTFRAARPTAFRMQLIDARFHTDMVRPPASETSWWRAFGNAAPTPGLRAAIPSDAAGAMVTQLDATLLEQQFTAWAGLDGAAAGRLAEMEERHGFSLRRDVFGSMGSDVAMFVMPVNSIGLPNAVAVMELRDAAAFERGMQGLASAFAEAGASSLSMRAARYRDAPMWSFEMERAEQGALPFEISPTIAIVGSRAVLTTTTLFAKREIKRLATELAPGHATASIPELPAGATLTGSMDWPTMIASLYTSLRGAAALAGSFADLPIDLGALTAGLPDRPETFTRFFSTTRMWGAPLGERFHLHMESSFGPETWLGLVGFATSAMRSMSAQDKQPSESEAPAAEALTKDDSTASLELTRAALDRIGTRLLVFQLDRGNYPDTLEELARPSPNYPEGYLDGQPLPTDGWGRALAYRRSEDGGEYRVWSLGADGVDASGDEVAP